MQLAQEVVWCPVEGEMVLFHSETGEYYGLNEVAARVWRLIAEGASQEAMIERLLAEYEVDSETAHAEVARLIDEFAASNLVLPSP